MLWNNRYTLIKDELEAVVVGSYCEGAPQEIGTLVTHRLDEPNQLPLVRRKLLGVGYRRNLLSKRFLFVRCSPYYILRQYGTYIEICISDSIRKPTNQFKQTRKPQTDSQ